MASVEELPRGTLPVASLCTNVPIFLLKEKFLLSKCRLQLVKPGSLRIKFCEEKPLHPSRPAISSMPTIPTFPGEADIEGPRAVRAVPAIEATAELKIE